MRRQMTDAEWVLWEALRDRRLEGFKFRRQMPLHGFILDFVCLETGLIVEVDGAQHAESQGDQKRDAALAEQGFTTMRFWNEEVLQNADGVCLAILQELRSRTSR
jgi:very-short-patch-repair endonuclease